METIVLTIIIVMIAAVLAIMYFLLKKLAADHDELIRQSSAITQLSGQLQTLQGTQEKGTQLIEQNLRSGQESLNQYLLSSQELLNKLHQQIGGIQNTGQEMLKIGTDVRSLQDILKNPKLRGQLGERSLEKLLREILPAG